VKLELPTGRVVELTLLSRGPAIEPAPGAPLFAAARELLRTRVAVTELGGARVDAGDLALADFHALRAIAAHEGWLAEEEVAVECLNCGAEIRVRPSRAMPLGPFVERALDDPELDARLEPDVAHPIPPIALPGGPGAASGDARSAREIVLRSVTVREAEPLHAALAAETFAIDGAVARAMGIVALGGERDPATIGRALDAAIESDAFDAVARLFDELHYSARLFGVTRCAKCGARNDVDAPFEREFAWTAEPRAGAGEGGSGGRSAGARGGEAPFVRFRAFAARARALAREIVDDEHEPMLTLIVEGGVPPCDDGGAPLLGSYVPASAGDETTPSRPHEIAVYYRTFRAMWREEGAYDWEAELAETLEHEYEHLLAELAGGDPMDEREREAIDEEAARIHGKSTLMRAEVKYVGGDFVDFLRRTWIVWVVILAALLLATLGDR
jgi:hypothetical protein